jgi:hypothetical protein
MSKILNFALPSALLLSTALHAQGRHYAQGASEDSTEDTQPAPEAAPSTEAPEAPLDENLDSKETDSDGNATEDDSDLSYIIRQSKTKSAEVFVEYNTFRAGKEYFTPVAYGVRGFLFKSADVKYGLSLAGEKLYYGFDEKNRQSVGSFTYENVKRTGSALRLAAHTQYFFDNSLNIGVSVFGASGQMNSGDGYGDDYYSRTGFSVGFGNQWSWQDYTVGFNWLTLTYNTTLKVGGDNLLHYYPSNKNGGMIVLSALSFGAEW